IRRCLGETLAADRSDSSEMSVLRLTANCSRERGPYCGPSGTGKPLGAIGHRQLRSGRGRPRSTPTGATSLQDETGTPGPGAFGRPQGVALAPERGGLPEIPSVARALRPLADTGSR